MKIQKLRLVNFMPFAKVELDLVDRHGPFLFLGRHADGVEGESNGAGKSSVLEAILWALYGESRGPGDDDLIRLGEDDMSVVLNFQMEGKGYEISRTKRRGRSQVLALTNLTDDVKLTGNSVRETQEAIVKVLGMDHSVFVNTVFCAQNEIATFAGQPPSKRKAMLADILRLDQYSVYEDKAKTMARGYEQDVASLSMVVERTDDEIKRDVVPDGIIEKKEESLQANEASVQANTVEADGIERNLAEARAKSESKTRIDRDRQALKYDLQRNDHQMTSLAKSTKEAMDSVDAEVRRCQEALDHEPKLKAVVQDLESRIKDVGALAEKAARLDEQARSLNIKRSDCVAMANRLSGELDKLRARLANVQALGSKCPMCQSDLTEAKRFAVELEITTDGKAKRKEHDDLVAESAKIADQITNIVADMKSCESDVSVQRELERDLKRYQDQIVDVSMARERMISLDERAKGIKKQEADRSQELISERSNLTVKMEALDVEAKSAIDCADKVLEMEKSLSRIRSDRTNMSYAKDALVAEIATLKSRRDAVQKKMTQVVGDRIRLKEIQEQEFVYKQLALAFGKNGIPALIMDNALAEIQDEVKKRLDDLSRGKIRVEFSTQRELKTGKTAESMEILVSDESGTRDFAMYSGGEKARIALAIRLAMLRIMSRRSGRRIESLFIDEVSDLDPVGIDLFGAMVRDLSKDQGQVFVVSHFDRFKDQFPEVLTVTKCRGGSRLDQEVVPC